MSLLDKVEQRTNQWRVEDVAWHKEVEDSIAKRFEKSGEASDRQHRSTLLMQFLLSLLAAVVALLIAKIIPW